MRAPRLRRPLPAVGGTAPDERERRPWSVTLGLLVSYLEGIALLAFGARDPSGTSGLSGLTAAVLGVVVLVLATLTRTGNRVARACLLLPLVATAVVLVGRDDVPLWARVVPVVTAALVAVSLTLLPPSRAFFGDDATTLGTP